MTKLIPLLMPPALEAVLPSEWDPTLRALIISAATLGAEEAWRRLSQRLRGKSTPNKLPPSPTPVNPKPVLPSKPKPSKRVRKPKG